MSDRPSIVIELQRLSSDETAGISEVLRKALIVSTKLKVDDFKKWIENELSGYADKTVPEYRRIPAAVISFNPFFGWQGVAFENTDIAAACQRTAMGRPIGELEELARGHHGTLHLSVPPIVLHYLRQMMSPLDSGYELRQAIAASAISGIVERVRFMVLQWSLRLEEEGILGEGMTFSESERNKAALTPSIHFHGDNKGIVGNVTAHNLQIGNYATIHQQLKEVGISQEQRNELENILDELSAANAEKKESVMQRGVAWIRANAAALGTLAATMMEWFSKKS